MVFGLPAIGETSWGQKILDSINAVKATADDHIADAVAAHQASAISVAPTGGLASTDVQSALAELDSEKAPASSVADSGWQVVGDPGMPGFENGWVNYGGGEDVAAYRKINGVIYLRGTIKSGTLGSAAFTLPVGYRPSILPGVTNSGLYPILSNDAIGKLFVNPNTGVVAPAAPASNIWVSLAGVEFPVAT